MCDKPYTPINQQEITYKATFWDHSIPSHTRGLLLLFLSALALTFLTSCGLLGGKKKDHVLPGFIVFSAQDSLGHNELFRMKPDGSHIRQLTHMGSDGKNILYTRFSYIHPDQYGNGKLWIMSADGSDKHMLQIR